MQLFIDRPGDRAVAVRRMTPGHVVATAFGNFYALVAEPSAASVRAVNLAKGRPAGQVGSVTTTAGRVAGVFARVGGAALRDCLDALAAAGPIGFRGPARPDLPDHLTSVDTGVRTVQVITPGANCPANLLFARACAERGVDHLYVTSANRSRHLTGAAEEPAHWTAAGITADFAHLAELTVLAHRDEAAARRAYPRHEPMSVTVVSFHRAAPGRPELTVERHGSLHTDAVREIAARCGVAVRIGASARHRLPARSYDTVPR